MSANEYFNQTINEIVAENTTDTYLVPTILPSWPLALNVSEYNVTVNITRPSNKTSVVKRIIPHVIDPYRLPISSAPSSGPTSQVCPFYLE